MPNSLSDSDTTEGGIDMKNQSLLESFWDWAENVFTDSYKKEVENYLASSVDTADLENKIKLLKIRGLF